MEYDNILKIVEKRVFHDKTQCLVFSMDRSREEFVNLMLSYYGNVDLERIENGRATAVDKAAIEKARRRISEAPIYIDDEYPLTVSDIVKRTEKLRKEKGIGLVIIDQLQWVHSKIKTGWEAEMADIIKDLRKYAEESGLEILVLNLARRDIIAINSINSMTRYTFPGGGLVLCAGERGQATG